MRSYSRTALLTAACAAALTGVAEPMSLIAAPAEEVVRVGDHQMSCTALAAEINSLSQTQSASAAPPPKKKKSGLGFLGALGSAVPMLGGIKAIGGVASMASSMAGAAQSVAMQGQVQQQIQAAQAGAQSASAGPSVAEQRKQRLTAIFEEKHC